MLALSFKQPWAWLVAAGIKDVDNRTWWLHMPPFLNYPAVPRRIYVHASKSVVGPNEYNQAFNALKRCVQDDEKAQEIWNRFYEWCICFPKGSAIIGEVDIVACFEASQIGYPPRQFKGHQRFFKVEEVEKQNS